MDAPVSPSVPSSASPTPPTQCYSRTIDSSIKKQLSILIRHLQPNADADLLLEGTYSAIEGGKRIRGHSVLVGASIARDILGINQPANQEATNILAAAVELYQASALVHDDLIDHATTRRNRPTFTVVLDQYHRARQWNGSPEEFAIAGSVLLGDFLLSAADYTLSQAQQTLPPDIAKFVASRFTFMHAEVALGQYLDVSLQQKPLDPNDTNAIDVPSCLEIMKRKSARYSVVHPVAIGMMASGAPQTTIDDIENVLEPWGIAFQLRDDQLGVFGQSATTGKPTGDDIREGKRTALVAITWQNATRQEKKIVAQGVGNPNIDDSRMALIQEVMNRRGNAEHEKLISTMLAKGDSYLEKMSDTLGASAMEELHSLRETLTHRTH